MMPTFLDRDHGRDNNFNVLRMAAACAVLVSHAWAITLGRAVPEPLIAATGYSLGMAAVIVFFAISGYFITKSFDRRTMIADFAAARISRIFPGLVVALCLTAFVLGPFFTTLSLASYLHTPETWIYAPKNALLIHQQFALPGVFATNPFAGVANGSLWTLKYEVGCYAGVVVAGYCGLLRPKTMLVVVAAGIAAMIVVPGGDMSLPARVAILCGSFTLGGALYVYRAHVPISALVVLALAALAIATHTTRLFPLTYAAALAYTALSAGFADWPWLRHYNRLGDYSYGVYIYAFPIGQALVALFPSIGPWRLIAATFPIALLFAVLSWRFIEAPALRHRHRLAAWLRLDR